MTFLEEGVLFITTEPSLQPLSLYFWICHGIGWVMISESLARLLTQREPYHEAGGHFRSSVGHVCPTRLVSDPVFSLFD